jgi:RNA polymerase sigma-70 factor (sigma-E family)
VRFEDYVAQHGPSLLRFAYVLTGDPHLAEDLTQATLTDVYRHWRRVDGAQNPEAYVRRIMVNRNLGWHRRRSSAEIPWEQTPDTGVASDVADDVAGRDRTRRLLAGLAPRARTVLVLRYYADLDDAAIAEVMKISQSAVRATASRALATLRDRHGAVSDALEEA